jgi:hypothetical protein
MSGGSPVYAAIFLGMITFGTIEQWLLFRLKKTRPAKAKKDKLESEQEKRTWRGM